MARIPASEIEQLKTEVSLQRLVEARGIELKRHGADLIGHCPFHEDKTPSLVVSPDKNLWHCLGACQAGGTVIDWVMRAEGVSFRHAVELLREGGPALPVRDRVVRSSTVPKLAAPVTPDADDAALLRQVIDYYHATLQRSPEALAYLESRGLNDAALIERFHLGFANRTLGLRLPEKNRKAGAAIRTRLQKLGVVRDSGHEHFNGALVVPVLDEDGAVTEIYGRKIGARLRAGTPAHLYLPGPHRGLWNVEALRTSREIILCEALLDAMTFWCAGYRYVTAAYGVGGFTADHLAAFQRHGIERVLIAYDRDAAGDAAAARLTGTLQEAGIACARIQFPKGMDANAYALHVQPAAKALGLVIAHAREAAGWPVEAAPGAAPAHDAPPPEEAPEDSSLVAGSTPPVAAPSVPAPPPAPAPVSSPTAPDDAIETEVTDTQVVLHLGVRRYRVRGLSRNVNPETLKVNLMVTQGEAFHVDTLDLYAARARGHFLAAAATALEVPEGTLQAELGRVLRRLEAVHDAAYEATPEADAPPAMSEAERAQALALLKAPDLMERIAADFAACGVVGERTNVLMGYLAATSRQLTQPLAVVVQSTSAAGKSALMEAVLAFMPDEERLRYSAMTGQSLYYLGQTQLKHKILAIAEEEGVHRAAYALKLLQSEGELRIASTGKDPVTGNLVTQEYRVEGPVMLFLTTTAIEIDEELLNRCLVLSVDEGREQTRAIHRRQRARRTLAGLRAGAEREAVRTRQQHAQRLLRPLAVVNPHAERLSFLDDRTRMRRDHEKYLTLIDTIALLHQYQRPIHTTTAHGQVIEYIEVTPADIAQANALAHEVLGRSLDELPPPTRRLLAALCTLVDKRMRSQGIERSDVRFSRRDVREATAWGDTQLRVHLERLVSLEYVLVHRGRRGQSFVYELRYDGDGAAAPHLSGLIDAATIPTSRGPAPDLAGPSRPHRGSNAAATRGEETRQNPDAPTSAANRSHEPRSTRTSSADGSAASYRAVRS